MIHRSLPTAPRRGRFFLASGLGVTMLAASALAQVQPGTGQEASAPGADLTAGANTRAATNQRQGNADQPAPDRVVITGSFIPTAEGEGALPVAVLTQDDLRKTGSNSAAEGLRRLPSFVGAATTEADSNGGTGRAGVNLRGLGENNVLILINGHRAGNPSLGPSGFAGGAFTDANTIPFSAIDHIEVLKDGASAQYGSDAVAGVVNYILKTEFEGFQVDVLYGNTTNNDASTVRASAITGFSTKDKRFNVVLDANYYHANAIYSRDRFLSSIADVRRFGGSNAGSPSFPGRIEVARGSASAAAAGGTNLILQDQGSVPIPAGSTLTTAGTPVVGGGAYRAYSPSADPFNFRAFTPAIPEQERFAYYGATDFMVIDKVLDLYAYGLYSNNRQYNGLAPSPFVNLSSSIAASAAAGVPLAQDLITQYGSAINILRASPYNPVGNDLTRVRFRSLTLGPRVSFYDTRDYEGVFGAKGSIKTFNYDLTLSHTENKIVNSVSGDVRSSLVAQEVAQGNFNPFVGVNSPSAGTLVTADGVAHAYNNAAALQRASYHGDIISFSNLNFAEARLSNTFFPDAPQGGFSVALGGEYRRESFDLQTDPTLLSGDTVGGFNASASFHATQDVRSIFGELRLPIVTPTMNIPGIYNLSLGVAGRYQKFLIDGTDPLLNRGVQPSFETTNPKYEIRYQPIQDITLRGSYSTSFRAPSLVDLFQPAVVGGNAPALRDPLAQSTGQDPNVQPTDTTTGSPNLQPETTDSYTAGIVLSPRFAPGLNVTVDYYQINQNNLIITGGSVAQFYVNQNFFSRGALFSDLVIRDQNGGLLTVIERPFNAAKRRVEGIDVTVAYELDTMNLFKRDFGKFNFTLNYNHFFRFNAEVAPGAGSTNFLGTFSNAPLTPGSIPYNKALGQIEYQKSFPAVGFLPKSTIDLVATVNYIGDYLDDGSLVAGGQAPITDANGNVPDPANPKYAINRKVREYTTLDLQLSYTIQAPEKVDAVTTTSKDGKDGKRTVTSPGSGPNLLARLLGGTTLTVGCNDVFDTPPPFAAGAFNDNYDTSLYTLRNRFVYGAISKKF